MIPITLSESTVESVISYGLSIVVYACVAAALVVIVRKVARS